MAAGMEPDGIMACQVAADEELPADLGAAVLAGRRDGLCPEVGRLSHLGPSNVNTSCVTHL